MTVKIFLTFFVTIFLVAQVLAETGRPDGKKDLEESNASQPELTEENKSETIVITSESLVADNKKNTATFQGSVKAVKGDIILFADEMTVFYTEDQGKIKRIVAEGNTKLVQGKRIITSDKAEYFVEKETIILTGNPIASEGNNVISGTKMEYFINNERVVVEKSKVKLFEKKIKVK